MGLIGSMFFEAAKAFDTGAALLKGAGARRVTLTMSLTLLTPPPLSRTRAMARALLLTQILSGDQHAINAQPTYADWAAANCGHCFRRGRQAQSAAAPTGLRHHGERRAYYTTCTCSEML